MDLFLLPIDDQTTRLIIRGRGEFLPDLKNALLNFILWRGVFEPAHFIMERKMMLGIKERAEADQQREANSVMMKAMGSE